MEKYNKGMRFLSITMLSLCACFFIPADSVASDTAAVSFQAKIGDGSCDIDLSDAALSYGVHRAADIEPASAVRVLPLYINIRCNGNTTPGLSVSGSTYPSSPEAQDVFFRDADSVATGVGFMVRKGESGVNSANFYNPDAAFKNGESIQLPAVSEQDPHSDYLLLGLVRVGSDQVTPGMIKSTLTVRVDYE
ncbi:fimbrial protein [uncultured Cedecea sp.]|uniref:fimbrial protein n=1 Tax=uncultured Cedecea sp. TaxID=988762 RepID=UPI002629ADC2|nr:fimbrial protein [uncultured Cedecea sp.]